VALSQLPPHDLTIFEACSMKQSEIIYIRIKTCCTPFYFYVKRYENEEREKQRKREVIVHVDPVH